MRKVKKKNEQNNKRTKYFIGKSLEKDKKRIGNIIQQKQEMC